MKAGLLVCAGLGCWLFLAQTTTAAPFVPEQDAQVLERLRHKSADAASRELRALRAQLRASPQNLQLAARVARRYVERSRNEADPRYLGYAQAVLAPWWDAPEPPVPVLVLRATIRQSNHDFDAALADLEHALKLQPANAQGWLTRATILQVQGRYDEAEQSCQHLRDAVADLIFAMCSSSAASLHGEAQSAYRRLSEALNAAPDATAGERVWILTTLAEMAERAGQAEIAERHFQQALTLGAPDSYLEGAYADFLLDQNKPAIVIELLKDETRADPLLLRLAIAERALGVQEAAAHGAALDARFAASRMRGDTVHRREEARFALHLMNHADAALELARANWQVQREPADARIFLEAALAEKRPQAAKPVLDWVAASKLEDARIADLVRKLRELTT